MLVLLACNLVGCSGRTQQLIILDVAKQGNLSMNQAPCTEAELTTILTEQFKRERPCPILIRASYDTPCASVNAVRDVCVLSGFWHFILALSDDTPSSLDPWTPKSGSEAWRIQFLLEEPREISDRRPDARPAVDLSKDRFLFNGVVVSKDTLQRMLAELGQSQHQKQILIRCHSDAQHGNLVWLLRQCSLTNQGEPALVNL